MCRFLAFSFLEHIANPMSAKSRKNVTVTHCLSRHNDQHMLLYIMAVEIYKLLSLWKKIDQVLWGGTSLAKLLRMPLCSIAQKRGLNLALRLLVSCLEWRQAQNLTLNSGSLLWWVPVGTIFQWPLPSTLLIPWTHLISQIYDEATDFFFLLFLLFRELCVLSILSPSGGHLTFFIFVTVTNLSDLWPNERESL